MKYITDINGIKLNNTIVMIGKFDGMHLGHQKLLKRAVELKEGTDKKLVIFTFNIIPSSFDGSVPEKRIITLSEMHRAKFDPAIDYIIECPFTDGIRSLSPDAFARTILVDVLDARDVISGDDFRFGINRAGDADTLRELGNRYGFRAEIITKLIYNGREVSSTYIKELITDGDIETAYRLLGKPFFMSGVVEHGRHVGAQIGFPTVNFTIAENKIMPPDGVYATKAVWKSTLYDSITNIGVRPTFDLDNRNYAETHILDFSGDLYGEEIKIKFYKMIRPVMKFASVDDLSAEIKRNTDTVREYFRTTDLSIYED